MAGTNDSFSNATSCVSQDTYNILDLVIGKILIPSLCVFGAIGNILNIVILTKHHLKGRIDSLEKSSYIGLIALAVSDLLYCLTMPYRKFTPAPLFSKDFIFYYRRYGDVITSTFVMSSTWLTVVMAVARYFVVCRPLRARSILSVRCMLISIILVFIISTSCNIPKIWEYQSYPVLCSDGRTAYWILPGPLHNGSNELILIGKVYTILRAVCGNFVPLVILTTCNIVLVRNLRKARKTRKSLSAQGGQNKHDESMKQDSKRITLTLVIIIIMFLILVAPHETANFILTRINDTKFQAEFVIPEQILTLCLVVNFSTNFVLYCVVSRIFRKVLQSWIKVMTPRCCYDGRARSRRESFTSASIKNNKGIITSETPLTEIQPLATDSDRKHSLT